MLMKVYWDNAVKKPAVYMWATHFYEGRESITDEERSGRPATSRTEENIAKFRQIVREHRRLAVRDTVVQENIDRKTVRKILSKELDMRKVYPTDFFLFPKIKETLKGTHFNDTGDTRSNKMEALNASP
ncbi:hypothetical protein B7P43_G04521 [Cryptotermes secundus]|uniref:Mos1 transposase HTH domain-containing protein n=1 Tax=Cryptotermes secundus TaxID=105785 RepID=A0A2J7RJW0_9NEOP|nr:hypothetical protein B7P43_G04521 [Cryptotermes secundus]